MIHAGDIAVFNLERTTVEQVIENVFLDARESGLEITPLNPDDRPTIKEQRTEFLGWLANKSEAEIEPLLDTTTQKVGERLAPWARLVIGAEVSLGREICLYSSTMPEPLMDAYADGIEAVVPDAVIEHVFGKQLEVDADGLYTGIARAMLKGESVEYLQAQGYKIELVADSFNSAFPAIKKAEKQLIVNPDADLRNDWGFSRLTRLYWHADEPAQTELWLPNAREREAYDLSDEDECWELLEDLGYNTDELGDITSSV